MWTRGYLWFQDIHCIILRDNIARQGYNAIIILLNLDNPPYNSFIT